MLLYSLLVPLLEGLHLFLLFVTAVNRFTNRTTDRATNILTSMVVTEDVSGTDAVRDQALLVFTLCNVLPQSLHTGTVRSDGTSSILVLTLGGVPEQQKPLLLMSQNLLPIRNISINGSHRSRSILSRRRSVRGCCRCSDRMLRGWLLVLGVLLWYRLLSWGWTSHNWIDLCYIYKSLLRLLLRYRLLLRWRLDLRWLLQRLMLHLL